MRKRIVLVLTAGILAATPAAAMAGPQVVLPGANDAPGSSDCHTNGANVPPGANGLCK
jgi:hypothetical protein